MKKILIIILLILMLIPFTSTTLAYAENQKESTTKLPILMYHSILNSKKSKYIVSEDQFESDISTLISSGYNIVSTSDVINYVYNGQSLPSNPILITFDDGHYNNMHYGTKILSKYNAKAIVNIIGSFSDYSSTSGDSGNPNYSHLTWSEIGDLSKNGVFEIGNHSYDMHKYSPRFGVSQLYNEDEYAYRTAIQKDIKKLQTKLFECTGLYPNVFAYPFGKSTKICEEELKSMGFKMTLTCFEGISTIRQGDPQCLFNLKRINRDGSYSTANLINKLNKMAGVPAI